MNTSSGSRFWSAENAEHAREQHNDAFPDETISSIVEPLESFENIDAFMQRMLEAFPESQVGEDNDGQLIVYTNLFVSSANGAVCSFDGEKGSQNER